jgi:DNA-binding transcriptional LysR family regulator
MDKRPNIRQLDLNLLRVFSALYLEQNMTHAADRLNVTPSAISHAVRRLRDALGDPLFVRQQNKMLPTAACKRMAPLIIESLTQLQTLLQEWGEFDPQASNLHFKIGMHDALEPWIVPRLAASLRRLAPHVQFSSIKLERSVLSKQLAAGELDVALDVALPSQPQVRSQKLTDNRFVVLIRRQHPLVNCLNKKNYLKATHINVSNRPSGMTVEDSFFLSQGLTRKSTIRCQNYFAAKEIVKNSDQLLTLSKSQADQFIDDEVVQLDLPFETTGVSTQLYWHASNAHDPALKWLRDTVIDLFPQTTT